MDPPCFLLDDGYVFQLLTEFQDARPWVEAFMQREGFLCVDITAIDFWGLVGLHVEGLVLIPTTELTSQHSSYSLKLRDYGRPPCILAKASSGLIYQGKLADIWK